MQIAPASLDQILSKLLPARLERLLIGIPLYRLTVGTKNAQLVSFITEARSHFARQVLSTSMEQPDHDCHLPASSMGAGGCPAETSL